MSERRIIPMGDAYVNADADLQSVTLTIHDRGDRDDGGIPAVTEIVLDPNDASRLLINLSTAVTSAWGQTAADAARGDCETCGNRRMVEVDSPGGRTASEHCPACYDPGGYPVPHMALRPQVVV